MTDHLLKYTFEDRDIFALYIDGKEWFVAKSVCKALGYSNHNDAVGRHCKKGGVVLRYIPTSSGMQNMSIITLPNLLRLIMRSKMSKAEEFQDWVVEDVVPSILKTGQYSSFKNIADPILQHTDETIQKQNSKTMNGINYQKGGVEAIKQHNRDICNLLTNKNPSEIKKLGREKFGLKSYDCTSAKQVLRKVAPQYSQAMSFTENLLKLNQDKTVNDFGDCAKKALALYDELWKHNIRLDTNESN